MSARGRGARRPTKPLVPPVESPRWGEADRERERQLDAALKNGDWRTAATLKLESAHDDMVRRDAALSELVADVQAGDAEGVQNRARSYTEWDRLLVREVETATEWAARAGHTERRAEQ